MALFTPEELAEMAAADAEIEREFAMTAEERRESAERERHLKDERKGAKGRKIAAYQRAYYEANKEEIAAYQRAYREANKEEIAAKQRAYYEANKEERLDAHRRWIDANRERWNAYQREYRARKARGRV